MPELMKNSKKPRSGNAVASFVLGMLFWMPLFNYFLSLGAIYFGVKALREIRDKGKHSGKLLALSGIVLGIVPYYFTSIYVLRNYIDLSVTALAVVITFFLPSTLLALIFVLRARKLL